MLAAAAIGASLAALLVLPGCAPSGPTVYRYEASGSIIDLFLNWYPELYKTGGAIELELTGRNRSIVVVRTAIDRFVAISPVCTYADCRVKLGENAFHCGCHKCLFGLDGSVVRGPAERPLQSYRTEFRETTLRIFLD